MIQRQAAKLPIAPHYVLVRSEFIRLHDKLARALQKQPRPTGPPAMDGLAALSLWEQWLKKSATRLPARLRCLSATVLAAPRPPARRTTIHVLISVEQEINRLIHLHHQLCNQPLPGRYEEGRRLLACCLAKIAADLLDLFSFFSRTMEAHAQADPVQPRNHAWTREISCGPELALYRRWLQNISDFAAPGNRPWSPPRLWQLLMSAKPRASSLFLAGGHGKGEMTRSVIT